MASGGIPVSAAAFPTLSLRVCVQGPTCGLGMPGVIRAAPPPRPPDSSALVGGGARLETGAGSPSRDCMWPSKPTNVPRGTCFPKEGGKPSFHNGF